MTPLIFDFISQEAPPKPAPKKRGRKKKPKKWSKPEGMPKRPLSAYNIFFSAERLRLLDKAALETPQPNGKGGIGFASLARTVALKWKSLTPAEKKPFFDEAASELARYKAAVKEWQDQGLDPRMTKKAVAPSPLPETTPLVDIRQFNEGIPTLASLYRQAETHPAAPSTYREDTCLDLSSRSLSVSQLESLLVDSSTRGIQKAPAPFTFSTLDNRPPMDSETDLEPLPFDYKFSRKEIGGLVQADYRTISARLFRELNSTLDEHQVGLLKTAFARSA